MSYRAWSFVYCYRCGKVIERTGVAGRPRTLHPQCAVEFHEANHGTVAEYAKYGCRCSLCCAANTDYCRERYHIRHPDARRNNGGLEWWEADLEREAKEWADR